MRFGRRTFLSCVAAAALSRPQAARARVRGLPHVSLGGLPTRVSHHPALASRLGLASLCVKRDDEAGAIFGGSKARKLERLLAGALEAGHRSVLTFGGMGSNHALATAIHAHRLGVRAHLVLLHEPPTPEVRRHLLAARHADAILHAGTRADRDDPARAVARFAALDAPYVIPPGGTSALGTVGYVDAGFELAEQIAAGALPRPDVVYVAAGTTGTAAGLWVGLNAAGVRCRLVAVRASGRATATRARVAEEVRATSALLRGVDRTFPPTPLDNRFVLEHGFVGAGYARPTQTGRRARAFADPALALDLTYTAKAFAALHAQAASNAGASVLFWHTFDPREPSFGSLDANDLPPALRGYARNRTR